jgi:hypothetical protein
MFIKNENSKRNYSIIRERKDRDNKHATRESDCKKWQLKMDIPPNQDEMRWEREREFFANMVKSKWD